FPFIKVGPRYRQDSGGGGYAMKRIILGAAMTVLVACAPAAVSNKTPTPAFQASQGAVASKVSANTATRAQMQAAFEAAGIPSPARMAMEVEEYRPYPNDDPQMAKLRK